MKPALDKGQFGPWALVTGASSGIGKEFARQIAASGINVVLVARRDALLAELGRAISQEFDVQYRALAIDLSQEGFIAGLADATHDIDIGLVVSNAGTPNPGEFLKLDRQLLQATLRLNTMAHLDITHHFGAKLAKLGFDPRTMPMKPMSAEQCVSEGLNALRENRSRVVPGRINRIMNALVPASVKRTFTAKMLGKSLRNRPAAVSARGEA